MSSTIPYKGQSVRFALFITLLMFAATLFKEIGIVMVILMPIGIINREGQRWLKALILQRKRRNL